MGLITSILLASAAAPQPAYPTSDVLSELKTICFTDHRATKRQGFFGPVSDAVEFWLDSAKRQDWTEVDSKQTPSVRDVKVLHLMRSLNHAMFGSFSQPWSSMEDKTVMLGGQVFKKTISGRVLYFSVFGVEADDGRTVGECRIHDPLGDGITHNPVTLRDVQIATGTRVRKTSGPFSSSRYRWTPEKGQISQLDVHFGFKGWRLTPFSKKIEQFDPYAPYGLTLVAGFHEQEIII